jgi:transposase
VPGGGLAVFETGWASWSGSCGFWCAGGKGGFRSEVAESARAGGGGYGPNLQAFALYLMVVHFVPAKRCVELLQSLTGAAPSVGFVHGLLERASGLLDEADQRIRALITRAYAVCADETPLRVGTKTPKPGHKKAKKYLLVACTDLYTDYLLGDHDLQIADVLRLVRCHGMVCSGGASPSRFFATWM